MGSHGRYGKEVLGAAAGERFRATGPATRIDYPGEGGQIDGVVGETIAVEVESRTAKQVRGAVLDLLCHPFPKKLLVLIPAHMRPDETATQCRHLFLRFGLREEDYRVVVLRGTGDQPHLAEDVEIVRGALRELAAPRTA